MKRSAPEASSSPSKKAPLLKSPSKASTDAGTDESSATTEEATQDFGVCTQTQEFDTAPAGSRKLQIFSPKLGKSWDFNVSDGEDGKSFGIGRDSSCEIVVHLPAVSRFHATIKPINGSFWVADGYETDAGEWKGSRNGTAVARAHPLCPADQADAVGQSRRSVTPPGQMRTTSLVKGKFELLAEGDDIILGSDVQVENASQIRVTLNVVRADRREVYAACRVFISHKQSDGQDLARILALEFASRGIPYFLDVDCLESTHDLEREVSACTRFVCVMTPDWLKAVQAR